MKSVRTLAIVIMVMVSIFFLVYAKIQRGYAVEVTARAQALSEEAIKMEKEVNQMKKEAERQAEIAMEAKQRTEELQKELANCRNK